MPIIMGGAGDGHRGGSGVMNRAGDIGLMLML